MSQGQSGYPVCGHTGEWWNKHKQCATCGEEFSHERAAVMEVRGVRAEDPEDPAYCCECGHTATHKTVFGTGYCRAHRAIANEMQTGLMEAWVNFTFSDMYRRGRIVEHVRGEREKLLAGMRIFDSKTARDMAEPGRYGVAA